MPTSRRPPSQPRGRRRLVWWLGWVVVGAGLATAVLLPSWSGCTIADEFVCGSAVPLIRLAVLAAVGILAVILTFVGPGSR